jgi:thioredoxin reductase (NADPH)
LFLRPKWKLPNMELHTDKDVVALEGDRTRGVTADMFRDCFTEDTREYPLRHLSLFIGADSNVGWSKGCVALDRNGFVVTGAGLTLPAQSARPALSLETFRFGVFAIGDVRASSTKRVAAAVGEGAAVVAQIHS